MSFARFYASNNDERELSKFLKNFYVLRLRLSNVLFFSSWYGFRIVSLRCEAKVTPFDDISAKCL